MKRKLLHQEWNRGMLLLHKFIKCQLFLIQTWLTLSWKALGIEFQFSNTTKKEEVKLCSYLVWKQEAEKWKKRGTCMVLLVPR